MALEDAPERLGEFYSQVKVWGTHVRGKPQNKDGNKLLRAENKRKKSNDDNLL